MNGTEGVPEPVPYDEIEPRQNANSFSFNFGNIDDQIFANIQNNNNIQNDDTDSASSENNDETDSDSGTEDDVNNNNNNDNDDDDEFATATFIILKNHKKCVEIESKYLMKDLKKDFVEVN